MQTTAIQKQILEILNQLETDRKKGVLQSLVSGTKNQENTGETLEDHFLCILFMAFQLTEIKGLTRSQKKKIDKRATDGCTIFKGICNSGETVYVLRFPKSSPDFIVIHPSQDFLFELKSSFGDAKMPTFNAGLNEGKKVRTIFYIYYVHSTNELNFRPGDEVLSEEASEALDIIHEAVQNLVDQLVEKYSKQLGIHRPWYPRRAKQESYTQFWNYSPVLNKQALDWLCK